MNLTGRPVYPKGIRRTSGAKPPNTAEKKYWGIVSNLPCVVGPVGCQGRITIHHCGTGAGGRKDHMRVIPLCVNHHLGKDGIDSVVGKRVSKKQWMEKYGTEKVLLEKVKEQLNGR